MFYLYRGSLKSREKFLRFVIGRILLRASGFLGEEDRTRASFYAEAIGDFAENDTGARRSFGAVVGGRNCGWCQRRTNADGFCDHVLQFDAGCMAGGHALSSSRRAP